MKYNIGDKIRFLNDVGGGTISGISGPGMVNVMDEDGFEMPVPVTNIIVVGKDDKYGKTSRDMSLKEELSTRNKIPEPEKIPDIPIDPDPDIVDSDDYELLLAFVPKDRSNPAGCLDLYFINDSSFYCTYIVAHGVGAGRLNLLGNSTVEPETKEYVCSIDRDGLDSKFDLNIVSFLYKHKEYKYYPPEQTNIDLNPVKFFRDSSFIENDFFDEKAYILKIAASNIPEPEIEIEIDSRKLEEAIMQKDAEKPEKKPVRKSKPGVEEVDLHIEELIDDTRGLNNAQMLEIQKARFIAALEAGFIAKTGKMVFIHGVGNGKLKYEIRQLLDTQYAGLVKYYDASFLEYGFGATMVVLR
jgi:hypothetical protein